MRSACHSQDAYLSFSLFLTIPLDLWLPLWLSVSISLPLYVSGSTALSASSSHSPSPSVYITAFEHKYAQVPPQLFAVGLPCLQWLLDQALLLSQVCTASITPWLSHCLAEPHVFIWSLWEFATSEGFTPQITSDLPWEDDDLLHFEWVLDYVAHSSGYHTAPALPGED